MSYTPGGLIQATDYNSLASTLNSELGVGSASHGLGQPTVAGVAATNSVTASQWTTLIQKSNAALAHKGITQITPASVTTGNLVTCYSAIQNGVNDAYNNPCVTGVALSDSTAYNSSYTGAWGTAANRAVWHRHIITFASGEAARYFFNAGGRLKFSFSKSGGSATARNSEWAALATACGSVQLRGIDNMVKVGGSGTVSDLGPGGYWTLSGTNTRYFLQYDNVGTYSSNWINLEMYWGGTAGTGGGYNTIAVHSVWQNVWTNAFQDGVDGTSTSSLVIGYPSTSYLTNTWGTPTVATASWIG